MKVVVDGKAVTKLCGEILHGMRAGASMDEALGAARAVRSLQDLVDGAERVGATGENVGATGPDDLGSLKVALGRRGDRLVLDFGKEVSWVSMTGEEALAFGAGLVRMARAMPDGPKGRR